jgi:hypothetical protein
LCFACGQVRDNLSEGLRFYASLQEALTALAQHVGDFCLTRRIQRWTSQMHAVSPST